MLAHQPRSPLGPLFRHTRWSVWTNIRQQTDITMCGDRDYLTGTVLFEATALAANDCDASVDDEDDNVDDDHTRASSESNDNDCNNAKDAKCKNGKAWSIIGVLANAAALGLLFSGAGPAIGPSVASALASVSYLIIWSIVAAMKNATDNNQSSGCGYVAASPDTGALELDAIDTLRDGVGFGAAFGCFVTAWILTMVATVLSFLGSQAEHTLDTARATPNFGF